MAKQKCECSFVHLLWPFAEGGHLHFRCILGSCCFAATQMELILLEEARSNIPGATGKTSFISIAGGMLRWEPPPVFTKTVARTCRFLQKDLWTPFKGCGRDNWHLSPCIWIWEVNLIEDRGNRSCVPWWTHSEFIRYMGWAHSVVAPALAHHAGRVQVPQAIRWRCTTPHLYFLKSRWPFHLWNNWT